MKKKILSVIAVLLSAAVVFGTIRMIAIYSPEKIFQFETCKHTFATGQEIPVSDVFKKVCENTDYSLFFNSKSGNFYVEDKQTGTCWYANPIDAQHDEIASGVYIMELCSSLVITLYDIENSAVVKKSSEASCIRKGNFKSFAVEDGIRINFTFADEGIMIPINIILEDDCLKVRIDTDEIEENDKDGFRLQAIRLLPNFGAAGTQDEGYAVIPDGCGAVMNFNNGKYKMDDYYGPVYGEDMTNTRLISSNPSKQVHLPIFGISKNGSAFLSVITKGATGAAICAYPNLKYTSYGQCFCEYTLHSSYNYTLDPSSSTAQSIKLQQTDKMEVETCEQKYFFLKGDNCGYNEMAQKYREYLKEEYKLKEQSTASDSVLLDFYGAVKKEKSVVGFPVNVTQAVSTLDDIGQYYSKLKEEVGKGISVRLFSWNDFEIDGKPEDKASLYSKIGSWSELQKLNDTVVAANGVFALGINLLDFSKNSFNYVSYHDSTKNMSGSPAYQYNYSFGTRMQDDSTDSWCLMNPDRLPALTSKFLKNLEKKVNVGLSPYKIANRIYGNYDKTIVTKENTKTVFEDVLGKMQKTHGLILEDADIYAVKYAKLISSVPTSSSNYDVLDDDIPFYQLSISGLCPYTTENLNLATDSDETFIKAVATGSQLHYALIAGDATELLGSDYDFLYSADSKKYYKDIVKRVSVLREVAEKTGNTRLVRVDALDEGIKVSQFENGCLIIVNETNNSYRSAYGIIEAKSYIVVEGSE